MNIKEAMQGIALDLIELSILLPGQTEPAYYKPMTLAMSDKIEAQCRAKGDASPGYKLATSIVLCLVDQDGDAIFSAADKNLLMSKVPQSVLIDIVNEMSGDVPTLEEAEGN